LATAPPPDRPHLGHGRPQPSRARPSHGRSQPSHTPAQPGRTRNSIRRAKKGLPGAGGARTHDLIVWRRLSYLLFCDLWLWYMLFILFIMPRQNNKKWCGNEVSNPGRWGREALSYHCAMISLVSCSSIFSYLDPEWAFGPIMLCHITDLRWRTHKKFPFFFLIQILNFQLVFLLHINSKFDGVFSYFLLKSRSFICFIVLYVNYYASIFYIHLVFFHPSSK
jgi:hypothetical protein